MSQTKDTGVKQAVWGRRLEIVLAAIWVVVAGVSLYLAEWGGYSSVGGWRLWHPAMLAVPLVLPLIVGLFSLSGLTAQHRFGIGGLLALGAALSLAYHPTRYDSEPNLRGVFVPAALYLFAVFLWLGWGRACRDAVKERWTKWRNAVQESSSPPRKDDDPADGVFPVFVVFIILVAVTVIAFCLLNLDEFRR